MVIYPFLSFSFQVFLAVVKLVLYAGLLEVLHYLGACLGGSFQHLACSPTPYELEDSF